MPKRVYIIHGWDGYPEEGWFPWLKKELEAKGFEVHVPQLPDTNSPRIEKWISALTQIVKHPDRDTYFVGHSMGCQAIARYLETLPENTKTGGAVFVAGFFKRLTSLEPGPDVTEVVEHWLSRPVDLLKVRKRLAQSVAIFSDNDPYVPLNNQDEYKSKLGSRIIIEHNKGHFNAKAGVVELPIVLEELLKMSFYPRTK